MAGQVVRQFSTSCRLLKKPNIQKPRIPGTERRILDAVTVPIFSRDTRPLPQQCYDDMVQKEQANRSQLAEAYLEFRRKQAVKMLNENKMIAICHLLPMPSRAFFSMKSAFVTAGMKVVTARNDLMKQVVLNTRLQNLEPYFTSDNIYIVSQENMLSKFLAVIRKIPEIQLLGGVVEDRILSRNTMMEIGKLPPLDILRAELVTILSASASKTSRLLGRHQQELVVNLEQLVKQGEGPATPEKEKNTNEPPNETPGVTTQT